MDSSLSCLQVTSPSPKSAEASLWEDFEPFFTVWAVALSCWKTILDMFGTILTSNLDPLGIIFFQSREQVAFQYLWAIVILVYCLSLKPYVELGEPKEAHGSPYHDSRAKLGHFCWRNFPGIFSPKYIVFTNRWRVQLKWRFIWEDNLLPVFHNPVLGTFTDSKPVANVLFCEQRVFLACGRAYNPNLFEDISGSCP